MLSINQRHKAIMVFSMIVLGLLLLSKATAGPQIELARL